ncbi:hypothetical protein EVAR_81244_1 [Eumeta japonica]|uniref:Uncharacterized protein n=1 Tax=Eumeta variegata TaxID=151549 RepID=A0A4C1V2C4_EUMVA|nr:hypothetical protein EVAR_81244_1 [Eumeta japonica]
MSKNSSTQLQTIPTHYYNQPYLTTLPPHHFIRRPRNVLSDPPDELTAEVERATRRRRHPMPIGRDRRSPQSSNLLGLRTTVNQQVASGVFWSVKVGHTPHARGCVDS